MVLEETGLGFRIGRLIAVYTTPHWITEYADGNRFQWVTCVFEAKPIGGELCVTEETTEVGYFTQEQMKSMDLENLIYDRVSDAFVGQEPAFVR